MYCTRAVSGILGSNHLAIAEAPAPLGSSLLQHSAARRTAGQACAGVGPHRAPRVPQNLPTAEDAQSLDGRKLSKGCLLADRLRWMQAPVRLWKGRKLGMFVFLLHAPVAPRRHGRPDRRTLCFYMPGPWIHGEHAQGQGLHSVHTPGHLN